MGDPVSVAGPQNSLGSATGSWDSPIYAVGPLGNHVFVAGQWLLLVHRGSTFSAVGLRGTQALAEVLGGSTVFSSVSQGSPVCF